MQLCESKQVQSPIMQMTKINKLKNKITLKNNIMKTSVLKADERAAKAV